MAPWLILCHAFAACFTSLSQTLSMSNPTAYMNIVLSIISLFSTVQLQAEAKINGETMSSLRTELEQVQQEKHDKVTL